MKKHICLLLAIFFVLGSKAQTLDSSKIFEAACGQCKFGMKGKPGCDLAIRIDGVAYFVDGVKIDSYGDAHAKDGFCNAIRKARVTGEIKNNRFVASSFTLLPVESKN